VLLCGNVLISLGVYFTQSTASVYALLYVWVGFQAAYFLPNRHAVAHVVATGVTYALALASVPGADRGQRWLLMVGVTGVIALMVAVLRERVDRLIARLAERLRRAVKEPSASGTGEAELPTVSFGVASFPTHAVDAAALMHSADQALYAAKAMGRDRSVIYNPEVLASVLGGNLDPVAGNEHLSAVLVLAETLDLRDSGTSSHSQTVGRLAAMIATALGFDDARVERIRLAGILHDIGKIGIPDWILHKPGKLDDSEWVEVKKHPEMGARIAASAKLDDISEWILYHHERVDGSGYPSRLPGDKIPVEAKILAVADAYEAMTAERVYKRAMPAADAERELHDQSGSQFDADVVAALLGAIALARHPERGPAGADAGFTARA
jgi:putative nucleotidyltransferase with HDIG domain